MKKLLRVLTIYLVGGTGLLSAESCCDTHTCCEFTGCWEIGLELLYWRPCICDWDYATLTYEDTQGNSRRQEVHVQAVKPSNHPGFRIFATYQSQECCRFATLDWLYLRSTDTSQSNRGATPEANLVIPFPIAINGAPAAIEASTAIGQLRSIYSKINLRLGQPIYTCHDLTVYAYAGARLVDLNTYRRAQNGDDTQIWRQRSEYSAFGVELGVGGDYCMKCGLGVSGWFGGTAAVGQQRYRSFVTNGTQIDIGTTNTTKIPGQTRYVPGVEARLGINYTKCCECLTARFEIGYEHHQYFGADVSAEARSLFSSNNLKTQCGDIGFGGPYLSLTVAY